jgi:hypothetical protein
MRSLGPKVRQRISRWGAHVWVNGSEPTVDDCLAHRCLAHRETFPRPEDACPICERQAVHTRAIEVCIAALLSGRDAGADALWIASDAADTLRALIGGPSEP